jgi:hypothetical protein
MLNHNLGPRYDMLNLGPRYDMLHTIGKFRMEEVTHPLLPSGGSRMNYKWLGLSSRLAICFVRKSWNMKSGDLRYLASYGANTLTF